MREQNHGHAIFPVGRQGISGGNASKPQVRPEMNSQTAAGAPVNKFLQKLHARKAKRTKVLPKPADQSDMPGDGTSRFPAAGVGPEQGQRMKQQASLSSRIAEARRWIATPIHPMHTPKRKRVKTDNIKDTAGRTHVNLGGHGNVKQPDWEPMQTAAGQNEPVHLVSEEDKANSTEVHNKSCIQGLDTTEHNLTQQEILQQYAQSVGCKLGGQGKHATTGTKFADTVSPNGNLRSQSPAAQTCSIGAFNLHFGDRPRTVDADVLHEMKTDAGNNTDRSTLGEEMSHHASNAADKDNKHPQPRPSEACVSSQANACISDDILDAWQKAGRRNAHMADKAYDLLQSWAEAACQDANVGGKCHDLPESCGQEFCPGSHANGEKPEGMLNASQDEVRPDASAAGKGDDLLEAWEEAARQDAKANAGNGDDLLEAWEEAARQDAKVSDRVRKENFGGSEDAACQSAQCGKAPIGAGQVPDRGPRKRKKRPVIILAWPKDTDALAQPKSSDATHTHNNSEEGRRWKSLSPEPGPSSAASTEAGTPLSTSTSSDHEHLSSSPTSPEQAPSTAHPSPSLPCVVRLHDDMQHFLSTAVSAANQSCVPPDIMQSVQRCFELIRQHLGPQAPNTAQDETGAQEHADQAERMYYGAHDRDDTEPMASGGMPAAAPSAVPVENPRGIAAGSDACASIPAAAKVAHTQTAPMQHAASPAPESPSAPLTGPPAAAAPSRSAASPPVPASAPPKTSRPVEEANPSLPRSQEANPNKGNADRSRATDTGSRLEVDEVQEPEGKVDGGRPSHEHHHQCAAPDMSLNEDMKGKNSPMCRIGLVRRPNPDVEAAEWARRHAVVQKQRQEKRAERLAAAERAAVKRAREQRVRETAQLDLRNRLRDDKQRQLRRIVLKEYSLRQTLVALNITVGAGSVAEKAAWRKARIYYHPDQSRRRGDSLEDQIMSEEIFKLLGTIA